jgi:preprotein translocase subunit SecA
MLTRQIEKAQRKVEAHNFDARKNLLEYDDVANDQRKVVYQQRNDLMADEDVLDAINGMREEVVNALIDGHIPRVSVEEQWDIEGLQQVIEKEFGTSLPVRQWLEQDTRLDENRIRERVVAELRKAYEEKVAQVGAPIMRQIEKAVLLQQLDTHWKEHLAAMDYLRQGIHLRGYAQRNPKQEYKREAFEMFSQMLDLVKHQTISTLARARLRGQEDVAAVEESRRPDAGRMQFTHAEAGSAIAAPATEPLADAPSTPTGAGRPAFERAPGPAAPAAPFVRGDRKVGRNEACPCGSGRKFKHCHGRIE